MGAAKQPFQRTSIFKRTAVVCPSRTNLPHSLHHIRHSHPGLDGCIGSHQLQLDPLLVYHVQLQWNVQFIGNHNVKCTDLCAEWADVWKVLVLHGRIV